mmetsp:Transcript_30101/g.82708  ORF Transcript_30101/g.82708 Transcript_30101/m.82708 type:complete len:200 (+) Transcript_30101:241-840(+)
MRTPRCSPRAVLSDHDPAERPSIAPEASCSRFWTSGAPAAWALAPASSPRPVFGPQSTVGAFLWSATPRCKPMTVVLNQLGVASALFCALAAVPACAAASDCRRLLAAAGLRTTGLDCKPKPRASRQEAIPASRFSPPNAAALSVSLPSERPALLWSSILSCSPSRLATAPVGASTAAATHHEPTRTMAPRVRLTFGWE